MKKKALKRGLSDLLSPATTTATAQAPVTADYEATKHLRMLPIDSIQQGRYQPRKDMDPVALDELTQSIRKQGLLQPIVVAKLGADRYEIIAGERRWRASKAAGLKEIPAVLREVDEESGRVLALVENLQRENLNPIEEAQALQKLIQGFGMTQQAVAEAVGKSRTQITNLMRLLGLQDDVRQLLVNGDIDLGHGKVLLGLPAHLQLKAAKQVVERALSVRETEKLIKSLQKKVQSVIPKKTPDPDVLRLQNRLTDKLGAAVAIDHSPKGKGKLTIRYTSLDELEGILAYFGDVD